MAVRGSSDDIDARGRGDTDVRPGPRRDVVGVPAAGLAARKRLQVECRIARLQEPAFRSRALAPYLPVLRHLSTGWFWTDVTKAQALLRRAGEKNPDWQPPRCPQMEDLTGWTAIKRDASTFEVDKTTSIALTNGGEWGSALHIETSDATVFEFKDSGLSPAAVVRAKTGFWVIESLSHLHGSGALSFLSRDAIGHWALRRLETFPSTVAA